MFVFFLVLLGSLPSENNQLRRCHRCQKTFPVLSDLFNHVCDDERHGTRARPTPPSLHKAASHGGSSLLDKISSTSTKSFKLNRLPTFNNSPISSSHVHRLITPQSPSSTVKSPRASSSSIHISIIDELNRPNQPSPVYKRPLFQRHVPTANSKPQTSSTYVYLRHPTSSIRVNS